MQLVSTQKLIPTIYYDFYGNDARFCQNRDSRHDCPDLANLEDKLAKT